MKRAAALAILLGASVSCSGPKPPPGDAGFYGPSVGWGSDAFYAGGSTGNGGLSGTGGSFGGNPRGEDAGAEPEPERRRDGGGGGGPPNRRRDAGAPPDATTRPTSPDATVGDDASSMAECPAGAASGETCMMAGVMCMVAAGDGGRGQICTCRSRGGESSWRCNNP
jgi:hypothetical protein